jgi:hypothetical protein
MVERVFGEEGLEETYLAPGFTRSALLSGDGGGQEEEGSDGGEELHFVFCLSSWRLAWWFVFEFG